jgi:hypothetical protein
MAMKAMRFRRGSSKGVSLIDLPQNRSGDSQDQLEMGRTPKATTYQTSFVIEDLIVYKNEPTPIRRQTTWNISTNTNKKNKEEKGDDSHSR